MCYTVSVWLHVFAPPLNIIVEIEQSIAQGNVLYFDRVPAISEWEEPAQT